MINFTTRSCNFSLTFPNDIFSASLLSFYFTTEITIYNTTNVEFIDLGFDTNGWAIMPETKNVSTLGIFIGY